MAYIPIIDKPVGKAIKKEFIDLVVNNLADHEQRINSGEAGAARITVFNLNILNAASANSMTGLTYSEALSPFTLTGCEIRIFEKGVLTGSLEVDVKKSTSGLDSTDFVSVFTTKPKIDFATAVNYQKSINQVFNNAQILVNAGDTLRLDVTQLPVNGTLGKFRIILFGEV